MIYEEQNALFGNTGPGGTQDCEETTEMLTIISGLKQKNAD
jgi:hypothetical protein